MRKYVESDSIITRCFLQLSDHDLEQFYASSVVWNGNRENGATFLSERKVEGSYLIRDGTQPPGSKVTLLC